MPTRKRLKKTRKKSSGKALAHASKELRGLGRSLVAMQVHYRVSQRFVVDLAEDISPGGIFIRTPRPLPKGTLVEILFGDPMQGKQVIAEGRVAWSNEKKSKHSKRIGMGIEFTRVDVAGQRFIDNLIHDFLRNVSVV